MKTNQIIIIIILLLLPAVTFAQGNGGGGDPDVPLDGGLSILLAAGAAYGAKKIWKRGEDESTTGNGV